MAHACIDSPGCPTNEGLKAGADATHATAKGAMGANSAAGAANAASAASVAGGSQARGAMGPAAAAAAAGQAACQANVPIAQSALSDIASKKGQLCPMFQPPSPMQPPQSCPNYSPAQQSMDQQMADLAQEAASNQACANDTGGKEAKNQGNEGKMPSMPQIPQQGKGGGDDKFKPDEFADNFKPFEPEEKTPEVKIDKADLSAGPKEAEDRPEENDPYAYPANPFLAENPQMDVAEGFTGGKTAGADSPLDNLGPSLGGSGATGGVAGAGNAGGFSSGGPYKSSDEDDSGASKHVTPADGGIKYTGGGNGRPSSVMAVEAKPGSTAFNDFMANLNKGKMPEDEGGGAFGFESEEEKQRMLAMAAAQAGLHSQDGSSLFSIVRHSIHQAWRKGNL